MKFHDRARDKYEIKPLLSINSHPKEDLYTGLGGQPVSVIPPNLPPYRPQEVVLRVLGDDQKTNTSTDIGKLYRSDVEEVAEAMSRNPNTGARTQPSFLFGNTKPEVTDANVQDHTGEALGSSEVVRLSLEGVKSTAPTIRTSFTDLDLLTGRTVSQAERQAHDWIEYFKSRPTGEVPADRRVMPVIVDPTLFAIQGLERSYFNEKNGKGLPGLAY